MLMFIYIKKLKTMRRLAVLTYFKNNTLYKFEWKCRMTVFKNKNKIVYICNMEKINIVFFKTKYEVKTTFNCPNILLPTIILYQYKSKLKLYTQKKNKINGRQNFT